MQFLSLLVVLKSLSVLGIDLEPPPPVFLGLGRRMKLVGARVRFRVRVEDELWFGGEILGSGVSFLFWPGHDGGRESISIIDSSEDGWIDEWS